MAVHATIVRKLLTAPTRIACVDDQREWKSIELLVGAYHLAGYLEKVCTTKTIAVLLPNSGAFPMTVLAGWLLGKAVVPLNFLLRPDELQYVIDDCDTDTVVSVGPMLDHLGFEPKVKNLVRLDEIKGQFKGVPKLRWPPHASRDDLCVLLYTSGTSGRPKGVMLTHGNIGSNIRQCMKYGSFTKSDVLVGVLPSFHSFGFTVLTMLPLYSGGKAVFTARFIPQKLVKLFRTHKPTIFVAIPSMYTALARVRDLTAEDFASFRLIVSGGEPLPDAVRQEYLDRFDVKISEGYGLTETSPVTNLCLPEEYRPHSVGRSLPDVEIKIAEIDMEGTLHDESDGEIRFRGPNVMKGYYKLAEETAATFDEKGFFRTGDIGRLSPDGHLSITGRLKEMLIVGGENVFPREIEEIVVAHPSISACGVAGKHDDKRGEVPVAFVEVKEDETYDEESVLAWCRDRLAIYKVPKEIRVLEELPRNPTGKVMRRELAEMLKQEQGAPA
ncbi:MAG: AMP-binding protein [Planctomycetota bacterium]